MATMCLALSGKALADYRGGVASMIFQDPMLALDPVYTIGDQIAEAIIRHKRRVAQRCDETGAPDAGARSHPLAGASPESLSA